MPCGRQYPKLAAWSCVRFVITRQLHRESQKVSAHFCSVTDGPEERKSTKKKNIPPPNLSRRATCTSIPVALSAMLQHMLIFRILLHRGPLAQLAEQLTLNQ